MPALQDQAKHSLEIKGTEIIDMLIIDVEPGSVFTNPFKARYFNINEASS